MWFKKKSKEEKVTKEVDMERLYDIVHSMFTLTICNTQAFVQVLARSNEETDQVVSAAMIAQLGSAIKEVYGLEEAEKVIDAYTGGKYSIKKELVNSGMTDEQAIEFVARMEDGEYDA